MISELNKIQNPFVQTYLEYVEDTESPRLFHVWSCLSGISACLGRRTFYPFGSSKIFPNMYILLVGPPGVRKSSAISLSEKRLKRTTGVRFAPQDTGGQRQGLIEALLNEQDDENEIISDSSIDATMIAANPELAMEALDSVKFQSGDTRDKHSLYSCLKGEFASMLGHGNHDLITFLTSMWDGDDYDYRTKHSLQRLEDPLLGILGGTTPTSIATALPPEATGQGFMSRVILVHADEKYKKIPRPKPLDPALEGEIDSTFSWCGDPTSISGGFIEEEDAANYLDSLYDCAVEIADTRFIFYMERRHTHLIKLSMSLAAARKSKTINLTDVQDAELILTLTERKMPDALGEYGLSPLAVAKQKMIDFLRRAKAPVGDNVLWTIMSNDMKYIDYATTIQELKIAKKIAEVSTSHGMAYAYNTKSQAELNELVSLIRKGA